MSWRFLFGACLVLFASFWTVSRPTVATEGTSEARIVGLHIKAEEARILTSFKLRHAFDETLQRRIDSGLPSGFTYRFQLMRDRKGWFDKQVIDSELQVVAMYNAVTREYLINTKHDGDLIDSRLVRDPHALEAAMTEFHDLPVFSLDKSQRRPRMRMRMRAELGPHTLLFFIPSTRTTAWVESPRFQLSGAGGAPNDDA